MANSIAGINDDIISAGVLRGFTAGVAPLGAFATNFSSDAAKKGDKVSVLRDNTAIDAVQTKATHADYTIQDCDSDAVEVSLGQPKYVSWSLDDTEVANSSVLSLDTYGFRKGNALAVGVVQDIWSEITAANFGAAAFTGAASTFDEDDVIDIKDACDDANWGDEGRTLIVSNAYYNALLKSADLKDASAYGSPSVVQDGQLPMVGGFRVMRSNIIPGNSENLVGFAVDSSALAVAMRYLSPQEGNTYNRAERLTGEGDITIGLRDWYDNDSGVRKRLVECVYGYETGIATGIKRMVSA